MVKKDMFYSFRWFFTLIKWSETDNCFYGKIENVTDLVSFEGKTIEDAVDNYVKEVLDYLKMCRELKKKVERVIKLKKLKEILHYGLVIFGKMETKIEKYKEGFKIEIIDIDEADIIISKKGLSEDEIKKNIDMSGITCTLYTDKDNIITHIETGIGGLFTLANKRMGIFLYELIGTKIKFDQEVK